MKKNISTKIKLQSLKLNFMLWEGLFFFIYPGIWNILDEK